MFVNIPVRILLQDCVDIFAFARKPAKNPQKGAQGHRTVLWQHGALESIIAIVTLTSSIRSLYDNNHIHNNTDSVTRHQKSNQLVYPITSFSLSHPGSVSGCPGLWAMKLRSSLGFGGSSNCSSLSLSVPF